MAKSLWFTSTVSNRPRDNNDVRLDGTATWWLPLYLSESRGPSGTGVARVVATVAGLTNGREINDGNTYSFEWISDPLSAAFTISGTITLNLWAFESSNTANAAINAAIDKIDGATGALTRIATSARVTELGTASAAANFTVAPTSTACKRGDRLRVRAFADDAGTMGSGQTVTFNYDRSTAGVQGDSFVTFTENLTFDATTTPTGSTYYLTDTAASINPGAATEKVASTTRGSGSVNAVTNTAAGPTSGIQVTDSAGGTAIEWYTPPLNAFTLSGIAQCNIRALESSTSAEAGLQAEIAVCANDGSSPIAWGVSNVGGISGSGEIHAADTAETALVSGDDTSVAAGQRLRFRLFVDDKAIGPLVTGFTVTVSYNGTSAAAAGDTYVILPVAVTEQAAGATSLLWSPASTLSRM